MIIAAQNNYLINHLFEKSIKSGEYQPTEDLTESVSSIKTHTTGETYFGKMLKNRIQTPYSHFANENGEIRILRAIDQDAQVKKAEQELKDENETVSNIMVNPDGSRVLLLTTKCGSMQTTMSIEITKPTDFPVNEQNTADTEPLENHNYC